MILSLSLQVFLLLFSPLRKRTSKWYFRFPIWFAYIHASNVAHYALGLFTTSDETCRDEHQRLILWAPFLLAHLGGFDTITAYSLQDNELWHRNFSLLPFKVGLCILAFARLGTYYNKTLWVSIIFVFLVGIIKCFERIMSLYLASPLQIQKSLITPEPRFKPLVEFKLRVSKWKSFKEENVDELYEVQILQIAYVFFHSFQRLVANLSISLEDRKRSRNLFIRLQAKAAYRLVETELNFLYDTIHTKFVALWGISGVISRLFSFVLLVLALSVFIGIEKEEILSSFDIGI